MPDTRHRTTIEIGVDDRQLRNLAQVMERVFSGKTMEAFEASMERSSQAIEGMVSAVERLKKQLDQLEKQQKRQQGGGGGGSGGAPQQGAPLGRIAAGSFIGNMGAQAYAGAQRMGQAIPAGQATTAFLGGIPIAGGFLSGAAQAALGFYQTFASAQQARYNAFGAAGAGSRDFISGAAALGISPMAAPGMRAQFAGLTGRRGIGVGLAGDLAKYQQLMGLGSAGSLIGAQEMGGRMQDPEAFLERVISAGIGSGIREARLDRFLQQVASFVEQAQSQGIPIQAEELTKTVQGFSELGLSGEAAANIGQNFAQSMRNISMSGQGAQRAFALTVLGGMGQDGVDYMEAMRGLQENPAAAAERFSRFVQGNPLMAMLTGQMIGMPLGVSAAEALSSGRYEGFARDFSGTASGALAANFGDALGEGMGTSAAEAGYESQRISLGGNYQSVARKIRNFDMKLARHAGKVTAELLDAIITKMEEALQAFKEGGIGGLLGNVAQQLGDALRGLMGALTTALGHALKRTGEALNLRALVEAGEEMIRVGSEDPANARAQRRRQDRDRERNDREREHRERANADNIPQQGRMIRADGSITYSRQINGGTEVYDSRTRTWTFHAANEGGTAAERARRAGDELHGLADVLDAEEEGDLSGPD